MCLVGSHLYVNVVICHRNTFTQACHYSSTQPNVTSEPPPGIVGKRGAGYHLSTVSVIHPDQRCVFVCTSGIEVFVLVNEMDLFWDIMIGCWSEPMGHYLSLSDMVELCVCVCVCVCVCLCSRSTPLHHSNNLHCFKMEKNHYFSLSLPSPPPFSGLRCTCFCGERCDSPAQMRMFFSLYVWEELASTLQCCFSLLIQTFYTLQKDAKRLFRTHWAFYSFGADELSQVMLDSGGPGILQGFKTTF